MSARKIKLRTYFYQPVSRYVQRLIKIIMRSQIFAGNSSPCVHICHLVLKLILIILTLLKNLHHSTEFFCTMFAWMYISWYMYIIWTGGLPRWNWRITLRENKTKALGATYPTLRIIFQNAETENHIIMTMCGTTLEFCHSALYYIIIYMYMYTSLPCIYICYFRNHS